MGALVASGRWWVLFDVLLFIGVLVGVCAISFLLSFTGVTTVGPDLFADVVLLLAGLSDSCLSATEDGVFDNPVREDDILCFVLLALGVGFPNGVLLLPGSDEEIFVGSTLLCFDRGVSFLLGVRIFWEDFVDDVLSVDEDVWLP